MKLVSLCDLGRTSVAIALALLLPWLVVGQEQQKKADDKAVIHGTITDQTQAVVTGATVVLTNTAGFKKESQSD